MTTVRRTRLRTLAPIAGAALAVASAGMVAMAPSASAAPGPTNCSTTGRLTVCDYLVPGPYQLFIPDGVSRVAVLAVGAGGGKSASAAGGLGQQVTDYVDVSPGDFLYVNVGGPANNVSCSDERVECSAGYGEGGFSSTGGGGGGASDVRTSPTSQPGSQASRVVVAGGGGGGGGGGGTAGGVGGNAGAAGASGGGGSPGGGGTPGTQSDAGKGGTPNGTDGFLDKGGSNLGNAGAGGGGYYGGGSGGEGSGGGGGGGGSSLVAHESASVTTATQRAGRVQLRYAVDDRMKPTVHLVLPGAQEATSAAGAVVDYTATATDDVDGAVPITCSPESGTVFAIGTTEIQCEATDISGNTIVVSAGIVVVDTTAPTLSLPASFTVPATNLSGAVATYTATATDVVAGSITPDCRPSSGSTFPIGTTTVVCTARDGYNNLATGSFTITVADQTPPVLGELPDLTAEASGPSGAEVTFAATATDAISQPVTVGCSPSSGSTFAIGTTPVSCTATDGVGNTSTKSFTVTVVDTTAPVVTVPAPIEKQATGPSGAAVTFTATASDTVSGSITPTCTPPSGSTFGITTTTVTCSATDAAGNTGTASFTVKVIDTQGPSLSLPANQTVAATSANGAIASYTATATDLVDGPRPVSCSPASGTVFPVGTTTVTCTASDTRGNQATGTFTVTVQPYRADLQVTVTGPTSVTRGGVATYTVTVKNTGPSTASNVRTVLAASGLSVTSTNPSTTSGSVKIQGVTYTGALWTTATIPVNGSVTFTLSGTVTAKKGDSVVAQGAATSDVPDPATTNNVARVTSTVPR